LYDDDAAVTTTDLGSDQATHQLDSAFPPGWIGPGRDPWGGRRPINPQRDCSPQQYRSGSRPHF
jgi:hypothetical protein